MVPTRLCVGHNHRKSSSFNDFEQRWNFLSRKVYRPRTSRPQHLISPRPPYLIEVYRLRFIDILDDRFQLWSNSYGSFVVERSDDETMVSSEWCIILIATFPARSLGHSCRCFSNSLENFHNDLSMMIPFFSVASRETFMYYSGTTPTQANFSFPGSTGCWLGIGPIRNAKYLASWWKRHASYWGSNDLILVITYWAKEEPITGPSAAQCL